MIDLAAAVHFFAVIDFKECDALVAAFEEALPIPLVVDFQPEKIDVKFPGAREVFDVKDHMIDTAYFERCVHDHPP
jgi:methyl coenzyme M reductase subunit C-like uncharacterized protein (methanogenesis marker protein 7)